MSKIDDELTGRFHRAQRPVASEDLFEGLARRRRRRRTLQRVQAGATAVAVVAATAGGFLALTRAFEDDGRDVGETPIVLPANGEIVFSDQGADGYTHLYAMQPDGSERRQITDFGTNDTYPAVSPDGRTIAFVHQLEDRPPAIATIPIDGGVVTWLTDPDFSATSGPSWSPDGSQLVVSGILDDRAGLFLLRPHGDLRPLTTDPEYDFAHPDWSPNGDLIAYSGRDAGESAATGFPWRISTIGPDGGGGPLPRPAGELDEHAPTWSPDGTRIAFLRPGDQGDEIWTMAADGGDETLIATAVEASLERDLAWAPDGSALLVSDGDWIYGVAATPEGDPRDNFVQLGRGVGPTWQPAPSGGVSPTPSPTAEPSPSAAPGPERQRGPIEVGLAFQLCDVTRQDGVDWLGDGTRGIAWVGTPADASGTCSDDFDARYGVAADFHGDGIADSWSGETIRYCGGCEPFKAVDLNGDGREELIVVLQYFSIMQYGVYTAVDDGAGLEVVSFRTGDPGHPQHSLPQGKPFTIWAGGDAGAADWFYCESLPELRLTGTSSPVDGGPDDVTTVHETHVSLGTDGIAHILDAETYTVPYGTELDLTYASSKPDCGLGLDIWRLQAA